jgi:hypothetical protein
MGNRAGSLRAACDGFNPVNVIRDLSINTRVTFNRTALSPPRCDSYQFAIAGNERSTDIAVARSPVCKDKFLVD